jgi:hypothetical protein
MEPFDKLRYFSFANNELQTIEKDLLKFNTKLEVTEFSRNKIMHIEPKVFDHLQDNLDALIIDSCANLTVASDKEKILESIEKINNKMCYSQYFALNIQLNSEAYCQEYEKKKAEDDSSRPWLIPLICSIVLLLVLANVVFIIRRDQENLEE